MQELILSLGHPLTRGRKLEPDESIYYGCIKELLVLEDMMLFQTQNHRSSPGDR